jgi:glycosyltransferase involved in cell wall biosynthesis
MSSFIDVAASPNPAFESGPLLEGRCVLSVAFPFAELGEDSVGGAEQITSTLDEAITNNGGKSLVLACEGSKVSGSLIPVPLITGVSTKEKQRRIWQVCRDLIHETLQDHAIDLIHFHGVDFFEYLPKANIPKLVTLHLPANWYPRHIFSCPEDEQMFLQCVSGSQQRTCPLSNCLLTPIENGVFVPPEPPQVVKSDFVFALGRICPEKGFHLALDAAEQAKKKMILAGATFPYQTHQHYFETEIVPRLNQNRQFIGPVGKEQKRRLMAQARCLLVTSLVPETSSLVAMEALACGTPVVAFRHGALSELIKDGSNGFLVQKAKEIPAAIVAAESLSSHDCWASVRNRFTTERMVERYLQRYRLLIQRGSTVPSHA